MQPLNIGLSSWIMQDGNYRDFEVEQEYRFALEFHAPRLESTRDQRPYLTLLEGSEYRFCGEIVLREPQLTVLDVGVLCYDERGLPLAAIPERFAAGELYLGIDHFSWLETHGRRSDVPNLFHKWRVREIRLETTPWVETESSGGRTRKRRPGVRSFSPVLRTNAWEDDDGRAHYVLTCELLGPLP